MTRIIFFDMDRTLLQINSGMSWMKFLRERGELSQRKLYQAYFWHFKYKLSLLDAEALAELLVGDLKGETDLSMREKADAWFARDIKPWVSPQGRTFVETHRKEGDILVLLTSSTQYVAEPFQTLLKLDTSICTRLSVEDGRFTGSLDTLCYGVGKTVLAERYAIEKGISLDDCVFYTDSYSDMPMLKAVGTPVVINPDIRLRVMAYLYRWPIHAW